MPQKLGQNFLVNKNVVQKIIEAADLKADDFVLEIGPGKGIITEKLAKAVGKAVAVEIDKNLVDLLKNKFKNQKTIEIIEGDILKINLTQIVETRQCLVSTGQYKLIANLPFYITSPIIRMFLEAELLPVEMILMVQKEVAERIVAGPGKMSILAVSVQYYADAEILFEVGKENFDPIPEVDSCVIKITPYPKTSPGASRHPLLKKGERDYGKNFFRIVRAGFCAKRKTLANNLANSFHLDKKEAEEKIKKAGINPTARAQELSIKDWKKLAELF